jgi:hypothetical protein
MPLYFKAARHKYGEEGKRKDGSKGKDNGNEEKKHD